MVEYTFVTDQGWKVTCPLPFSPSYAVLHTPCFDPYKPSQDRHSAQPYPDCITGAYAPNSSDDLLSKLTSRQLTFESFSADVLIELLEERVAIWDRNKSSILGSLESVSGEISKASLLRTPDSYKRRQNLEKTKMDLERELRETDERLWKDTAEIREKLIAADKRFDGTYLRSSLFSPASHHPPSPEHTDAIGGDRGRGYGGLR